MNTHLTPSFKTVIIVQEEPEQTQSKRKTEIVPLGTSMELISGITFIKLEFSNISFLILNQFLLRKMGHVS